MSKILWNHDQNLGQEIHEKGLIRGPSKTLGLSQQTNCQPCALKHFRNEKQVLSKIQVQNFGFFGYQIAVRNTFSVNGLQF
jgi:hypothetical protein